MKKPIKIKFSVSEWGTISFNGNEIFVEDYEDQEVVLEIKKDGKIVINSKKPENKKLLSTVFIDDFFPRRDEPTEEEVELVRKHRAGSNT